MKRILLSIALLFSPIILMAQYSDEQVSTLQNFIELNNDMPRERIFVHTDRQWYFFNDPIWFSAYVTTDYDHSGNNLSNVLYVEFLNPQGKRIDKAIVKVVNGRASGNLTFGEEQKKAGTYQIRAYTAWSLNFDEHYTYRRNLQVYTHESGAGSVQISQNSNLDVQFLPEGGNFIDGFEVRVGVKSLGSNGLGVDVDGHIENQTGEIVARFSTSFAGIGSFKLKPKIGDTYTAVINNNRYSLPEVREHGATMKVDLVNQNQFQIQVGQKGLINLSDYMIFGHVRGEVFYVSRLVDVSGVGYAWASKYLFPTGVVHFTVVNTGGEPVSERLVFNINEADSVNATITVDSHQNSNLGDVNFGYRELIELNLQTRNIENARVSQTSSLTVFDEMIFEYDEYQSNIVTQLYLEADLAGYVESPGFYFSKDENALLYADNLMLTQGWRTFDMSKVVELEDFEIFSFPERGISMAGDVRTDFWGRRSRNAAVIYSMETTNEEEMLITTTDNDGEFIIDDLDFIGNQRISLFAQDSRGRDFVRLRINPQFQKLPPNQLSVPQLKLENLPEQSLFSGSFNLTDRVQDAQGAAFEHIDTQMSVILEEVVVTARQTDLDVFERSLASQRRASQGIDLDAAPHLRDAPIRAILTQIPGVRVLGLDEIRVSTGSSSINAADGSTLFSDAVLSDSLTIAATASGGVLPLIIIDDVYTDTANLFNLNTDDIQSINVYRRATELAFWGSSGSGGVISVRTRRGLGPPNPRPNMITTFIEGYQPTVEFYSPRYGFSPSTDQERTDGRITLHWEPVIRSAGQRDIVRFWTNDIPGSYRVEWQGISETGVPFVYTSLFEIGN